MDDTSEAIEWAADVVSGWPATCGCLTEYLMRGWFLVVFLATPTPPDPPPLLLPLLLWLNWSGSVPRILVVIVGSLVGGPSMGFSRTGVECEIFIVWVVVGVDLGGGGGVVLATPPLGMMRCGLVFALAARRVVVVENMGGGCEGREREKENNKKNMVNIWNVVCECSVVVVVVGMLRGEYIKIYIENNV